MSQPTTAPTTQPSGRPAADPNAPQVQRQFVSFSYYKLDPAFRRLPAGEKEAARKEFAELLSARRPGMICLTYSTVGLKADADFMLWRISLSVDDFQAHDGAINRTVIGGYLSK